MTSGDPSRETLPDTLAVMTHPLVRDARRSGGWVLAANADLSHIVWASEAAATLFGLAPGPQMDGNAELAQKISAALQNDVSVRLHDAEFGAGTEISTQRIVVGSGGRECVLVISASGDAPARSREALVALSEIGNQPIAIWSSERSWFDAGFGATEQVYLEDLYDLKDGDADLDLAFLPNGKTAGLAKINRRLIAVWHKDDSRLLSFDLEPAAKGDQDTGAEGHVDETGQSMAGHHDGTEADWASTEGGSFTREIETIKSVSGSLLSAAGAALGGAALGRLAGAGEKNEDNDVDDALHSPADDTPESSQPSEEMAGALPVSSSDEAIEENARENAEPTEAHPDEVISQHAVSSETDEQESGTPSIPSSNTEQPSGAPVSILTFIAGGIGAAAAYHYSQKEREETAGISDEAVVHQPSPESGDADLPVIADDAEAEGRDAKASEATTEPAAAVVAGDVSTDDTAPYQQSPGYQTEQTAAEISKRQDPVRSNWSMPDAATLAASTSVSGSEFGANAENDEKVEPTGDKAAAEPAAMDNSAEPMSERAGDTSEALPDEGEGVVSEFVPDFSADPTRFVWRLDHEGRFHALSQEFAAVVGPRAADVIGISFADLSEALDLDPHNEIAPLIDRRETWSDRSVFWPVESSDKRVPIDLAALPVFSRDRSFDGFRGFGVARPADAQDDPEAWGWQLATGATMHEIVAEAVRSRPSEELDFGVDEDADPSSEEMTSETGRSLENDDDHVVQLAERRMRRDAPLSDEEAAAFRKIGVALSGGERSADLDEAIQIAKQKIALFGGTAPSPADIHPDPADAAGSAHRDEATQKGRPNRSVAADLQAYYGRLPVPILVQSGDHTVFTNDEFADLTGYRDATSLAAAGGLDHLFEEGARSECVRLLRANGKTIDVRARMQRIAMGGKSFLVISFFATPRLTVTDLASVPAPEPDEIRAPETPQAYDPQDRFADLIASVEAAGAAVLVLDHEGQVEAANDLASELFAATTELEAVEKDAETGAEGRGQDAAPIGLLFTELFEGESRSRARDLIREASLGFQEARAGGDVDLTIRLKDGGTLDLTAVAEPLEAGGWCVVMRDLNETAAKAAKPREIDNDAEAARLRAEDESLRKTQFLASVSHEIRTPMTAVLGFADAIESEAFGPIGNPRYLDYIADIKRSSRHVLDLVNDLLELSKAEAGRLELNFRTVALNQVAGEVVSMMQPVAGSARVVLRSNLPPSVPPVIADERSLRQIVTNLIQNAINSTPGGGQIILSSQYREDGSVTLRCRDNGVGMTEKELELAKQPYGRVKAEGGMDRVGTGLGLPLAYAMAEANGAAISIESVPQHGTMVELRFTPDRVVTG
ncbi:ATP-binding protein [Fulvimarina sp. MAC8]|uniref:sensor histidine kinase n=1 Tax=Fulvimarina sp. MAC8 TaxID=3162874 RepID=UPI0032F01329